MMTEDPSVIAMIKQLGDRIYYLGPSDFPKLWREEYEYHKELGKILRSNLKDHPCLNTVL
jgi:hypothetical protein